MERQIADDRNALSEAWMDTGFVCTKATGQPYHPDYVSTRFKKTIEAAGAHPIRFHDLRHTFATAALSVGQNPMAVCQVLGHSSVRTTLAVYGHVLSDLQGDVVESVADSLFESPSPEEA